MKYGHVANIRGVVGHPVGVTSIKDLYYLAAGGTETSIREIAAAGYDGVELFDGNLLEYPGGQGALKRLLGEVGLALTAVYCGANFIFPEVLPEELWRIERAAAAAAALAAEHLVVGGGAKRAGGPEARDYELLGQGLDRVVELARRHGLAAHFHPHLGTCVESPEQVEKALANSRILLCPDTAHLAAGGADVRALIGKHARRIRYVHLKDYLPEPFGFVPLGEGRLDIASIVSTLRESGYDGWLTVEADGFTGDPAEAARTSRRYLAGLEGGKS